MSWVLFIFFILAQAYALYYAGKSTSNLSEEGTINRKRLRRLGLFAPKRYFTETGWSYRKRAFTIGPSSFAVVVIARIIMSLF